MKRIYISAPYRGNGDSFRVQQNIERAKKLGRSYVENGFIPFVPHLAQGYFENTSWEAGNALYYCLKWLEVCDELHYFGTPTEGMKDEIRYANGMGIKVVQKPWPPGLQRGQVNPKGGV